MNGVIPDGLGVVFSPGMRPSWAAGLGRQPLDASILQRLVDPVPLRDRAAFYRQLGVMLGAGMAPLQALGVLARSGVSAPLVRLAGALQSGLSAGRTLADAMRANPWICGPAECALIEAAETAGRLDWAFERFAASIEQEIRLRNRLVEELLFPFLTVNVGFVVSPLPELFRAGWVAYLWDVFAPALTFYAAVLALALLGAASGAYDRVRLGIPGAGPALRKRATARFARVFALLVGAGVPVAEALTLAANACGSPFLAACFRSARLALAAGAELGVALAGTGALGPVALSMLRTGEVAGEIPAMMDRLAVYLEEELAHDLKQLTKLVGVGATLLVGLRVLGDVACT